MKQKIDWIEKRLTLRREADTMLSSVSPRTNSRTM